MNTIYEMMIRHSRGTTPETPRSIAVSGTSNYNGTYTLNPSDGFYYMGNSYRIGYGLHDSNMCGTAVGVWGLQGTDMGNWSVQYTNCLGIDTGSSDVSGIIGTHDWTAGGMYSPPESVSVTITAV